MIGKRNRLVGSAWWENPAVRPFVKKIAAEPADDLNRLVFADWIEELEGDDVNRRHAEYIRAAVENPKLDGPRPKDDRELYLRVWAGIGVVFKSYIDPRLGVFNVRSALAGSVPSPGPGLLVPQNVHLDRGFASAYYGPELALPMLTNKHTAWNRTRNLIYGFLMRCPARFVVTHLASEDTFRCSPGEWYDSLTVSYRGLEYTIRPDQLPKMLAQHPGWEPGAAVADVVLRRYFLDANHPLFKVVEPARDVCDTIGRRKNLFDNTVR